MATLKNWQKKYPDAISIKAKHKGRLSNEEANKFAKGMVRDAAVLEIIPSDRYTTFFFSKQALTEGQVDAFLPEN